MGTYAIVATAVFIIFGIGLLKAYKEAYLITIVISSIIIIWALFIIVFLRDYLIYARPAPAFVIIFGIIVFYLVMPGVREYFFDNKYIEGEIDNGIGKKQSISEDRNNNKAKVITTETNKDMQIDDFAQNNKHLSLACFSFNPILHERRDFNQYFYERGVC